MSPKTNRRAVLKLGLGASAAALLAPKIALSAPEFPKAPTNPTPLVDARFPTQIAENVWLIPDQRILLVPNIGIIVGKKSALIVDCGLGLESGERVLQATRKLAPGRKLILTTTHAHPEHFAGAGAFAGHAEILLNRQQNDYLKRAGAPLLKMFRANFGPNIKQLLQGASAVPATRTYDGDRERIDLGGQIVEFRSWGTAHSPGDQTIYLPDQKILFAGDLIEERMFPIVPYFPPVIAASDINCARWQQGLLWMDKSAAQIIVPGHGNLGGREIAEAVRVYLSQIRALATKTQDATTLAPQVQAMYPTWQNPMFIESALKYFDVALP